MGVGRDNEGHDDGGYMRTVLEARDERLYGIVCTNLSHGESRSGIWTCEPASHGVTFFRPAALLPHPR